MKGVQSAVMEKRTLQAITFLAPTMLPIYRFILNHLERVLGYEIQLQTGQHYEQVLHTDLAFICGLPYVLYTKPYIAPPSIEALSAPVLKGTRFENKPIYFSDVIVRRDSPFTSFGDLRGRSWAFNEPLSQSGYGITRYELLKRGEIGGYFGRVVESGYHQKSIQMVYDGRVDASAIDTQVLAVAYKHQPHLADRLRIIERWGPSTIQPLVANHALSRGLKQDIQAVLNEIHHDPANRAVLDSGFIDHFVTVTDDDYEDIRAMLRTCEQANFLSFHSL